MDSRNDSTDVRIWGIEKREGKRGTTYGVRWTVAGRRFRKMHATSKLADSFRNDLLSEARKGHSFDTQSGLPLALIPKTAPTTWLQHAVTYASDKWPHVSPNHRRGIAETLTDVTIELIDEPATRSGHDEVSLRSALLRVAFVAGKQPSGAEENMLTWLSEHSVPLTDLGQPAVARRVLHRLATRLDGAPAAASTLARKRAVFHNALDAAVELGQLEVNPLHRIKFRRPRVDVTVDRRAVVNPEQAAALLSAVRRASPQFEAFFACLYYAGLRPAEARGLTRHALDLPRQGWGQIELTGSQQSTSPTWTDSPRSRQDRPLKHRAPGSLRYVPVPPELVETLRRHLDAFACGAQGHLFVARTGRAGTPLSPPYEVTVSQNTLYRVWDQARKDALTAAEYASPLAKRPYDLRHAYGSTWLNAGVSPAEIAEQAGHSTHVLLKVYSKPVSGQEQRNRQAVEAVLRRPTLRPLEPPPKEPGAAPSALSSHRLPPAR